jgi:glycosyltransferase involved in cell wall biosynthesis
MSPLEKTGIAGDVKIRVLLSAYQCGPGLGSVSQIGWEWYSRLARRARVTLVTHSRNRAALQGAGAPLADSRILFVDTEWFAGPLYRFAKRLFPKSEHAVFLLSSLDYFVWDRAALRQLRKLRQQGEAWNIIHAVTPVSPRAATTLHRLGIPVVVGPWNGGLSSPKNFREIIQQDSGWFYRFGRLGALADRLCGTTRHCAAILSATRATDETISRAARPKAIRMLENGVDLDVFHPADWPEPPSMSRPLEIVFVGRLIPCKALPLLFDALTSLEGEMPFRLTVVGDGPMRQEWERDGAARGWDGAVRFLGNRPLPEVAAAMRAAHVFCLPSVRESGGAVLLEAMACQRPVIAIAHGGPAELVDPGVGVPVPAEGPSEAAGAMAEAFRDVLRRPAVWKQRGEEGRRRAVEQFSWDAKVEQGLALYRRLAGLES